MLLLMGEVWEGGTERIGSRVPVFFVAFARLFLPSDDVLFRHRTCLLHRQVREDGNPTLVVVRSGA